MLHFLSAVHTIIRISARLTWWCYLFHDSVATVWKQDGPLSPQSHSFLTFHNLTGNDATSFSKCLASLLLWKKMIIMLLFELVIVDWCRNMSFLRVRNANRPSLPTLQRTEVVQKCTGRLHDDSDDSDDDGNSSKSVSSSASQVRFCYSLLASLLVLYTWEHNNNVDQCCKLLKTFVWTLTFRGDNDAPAYWL